MKALISYLFIFGFSTLIASGQAPKPAQSEWQQEPTSFLGVQFGQPLRASIQECPRHEDPYGVMKSYWFEVNYPCFETIAPFAEIHNVSTFFNIYVTEVDGKVECINAAFRDTRAEEISQALVAKFGPPHHEGNEMIQNRLGASFTDHVLLWKGKEVEIDYDSVAGKVDQGEVTVYTRVYVANQAKESAQQKTAVQGIL